MVKRVVTGAHYGLKDWLAQRITALVMAVYVIVFVGILLACPPHIYEDWRALFAQQPMRIATLIFFLSLFWHAWLGMRDILMDYIKPTGVRLVLQVGTIVWLLACGMWALNIFMR